VERAVLLARGSQLTIEDLPPELTGQPGSSFGSGQSSVSGAAVSIADADGMTLREALEGPERQIILQTLRLHQWNRAATADALDINRTTLYKKMKRLGLDDPRLQFA
jgi:DNA-binding NtrC family response regulator